MSMDVGTLWGWLLLLLTAVGSGAEFQRNMLKLQGDYYLAGFFPLHDNIRTKRERPILEDCKLGTENKHGYHLAQALRFAVEEINNRTGPYPSLLPGVRLGYHLYDTCAIQAGVLASVDVMQDQEEILRPRPGSSPPDDSPMVVIGPDSSSRTMPTAVLLGAYLVPQISYEASNEMLSNKAVYPSFFRTIPSDTIQVSAMIQVLKRYRWTWIALLGSDNAYGLQGMQSLSRQSAYHDICIAYQSVLPRRTAANTQMLRNMVDAILRTNVKTIVLFSSKSRLQGFFPLVVERNVTGKIWLGSEDWIASALIADIPGIRTLGTFLGMSVKFQIIPGFGGFERKMQEMSRHIDRSEFSRLPLGPLGECLQTSDGYVLAASDHPMDSYDFASSFNVYRAVYAVAHALHKKLGCDVGGCQARTINPWQLLPLLKKVTFSVGNSSMYFDENGDPPTGYDIVAWLWRGSQWIVKEVGSYTPYPSSLTVNTSLIEWSLPADATSAGPDGQGFLQVPNSMCSPDCDFGHRRLQTGQHKCCFDCLACPAATFLNKSGASSCQPCPEKEWAPPKSEKCLQRTLLFLAWDTPLSVALLLLLAATLLLTTGSAVILLLHLDTPVVKSAGGRTCIVMLASLTAAAASALCHFGLPTRPGCLLKQPLFVVSFAVCLACVTVRAFQVVCIFKFASRLPMLYDRWAKNHGPEYTILAVSAAVLCVSVLRVAADPPEPSADLRFYPDSIVLECSHTLSPGSWVELACASLLSGLCFTLSYMGKDLPANYNEAKCVAFSLVVYMISWICYFTLYLISRDAFTMAVNVFAILSSVLGVFGGYFLPKVYIIIFRPQMNTSAHFQNCIQMYTMNKQ